MSSDEGSHSTVHYFKIAFSIEEIEQIAYNVFTLSGSESEPWVSIHPDFPALSSRRNISLGLIHESPRNRARFSSFYVCLVRKQSSLSIFGTLLESLRVNEPGVRLSTSLAHSRPRNFSQRPSRGVIPQKCAFAHLFPQRVNLVARRIDFRDFI